ncbi:MAG: AMP-binding protein [Rickettsiales bacterium]|jgi:long-chain acyl-CoA synthetase|nr:AMP-binding protein [Rickettsiales bacterium]
MNMYQFLEKKAAETPDLLILTREGVTYSQFVASVKRRATTLAKQGVEKGDAVGILAHNIPEWPLTLFAIWYLGGRAVLLDTNLTPFEYDGFTKFVDCNLVCAEKSFFYNEAKFKFYDIETKDDAADPDLKPADVSSTDIATLSFTSGSTGTPKAVPLTHFNLIECANSLYDMHYWFHQGDTLYGFLPLYHVYGFAVCILAVLFYNANMLLQPTINPTAILDDFKKYQPQIIPAVPRLWEVFRNKIIDGMKEKGVYGKAMFILKHQKLLKALGLGFLVRKVQKPVIDVFGGRACLLIAGGAATKPEVETFYTRLGLTYIQGYGLTETVGPICISKPGKNREPFAFGGPITNNECEIRNKNDDGVGVLWLRGHQVFDGYLNNDAANKEVFDDRGFFNTGDLVTMDKNGELHFAGRGKQVIVLDSGKNVYPDELEALYLEIPGVKNVAVFEHIVRGKTTAFGVFQVDDDMTLEKLAQGIAVKNKKIASYKWVSHFAMTAEELPMTSTQKIKHHIVKQNLVDGKYPEARE